MSESTTGKHKFQIIVQSDGAPPHNYGSQTLDHCPLLGERIQLPFLGGPKKIDVVVDNLIDSKLVVHVPQFNDIDVDTPTRRVWLDSLKEGDPVVIRFTRGINWEYSQSEVKHVKYRGNDRLCRIYADGTAFNRIGLFGSSYVLVEPTPRALNEVARTQLLERMMVLNWKRLPITVLAKFVEIIEKEEWKFDLEEELKLKE